MKKHELCEPIKNSIGWYVRSTIDPVLYLNKEGVVNPWQTIELGYWKTKEEAEIARLKYLGEYKMKKSDLKTGMVLEFDTGLLDRKYALLIGTEFFFCSINGDFSGSLNISAHMNEDLDCGKGFGKVTKIYEIPSLVGTHYGAGLGDIIRGNTSREYKELLWERPKPVEELTLEEVCKLLGKEIKIVKG